MKPTFLHFFVLALAFLATVSAAATLPELLDKLDRKPTPETFNAIVAQTAGTAATAEAAEAVSQTLRKLLGNTDNPRLPKQRLRELASAADAFWLLSLFTASGPIPAFRDASFRNWLLLNPKHIDSLLDNFSVQLAEKAILQDNLPQVLDIIHTLYQHDPADRDRTWPLILALALVYDTERPPLHFQMGPVPPNSDPDIENRYDFFKETLLDKAAPFPLGTLSVAALTAIVDTPLPVSELRWARKNIRERKPDALFKSIPYDTPRTTDLATLQWPHGPYTLEAIRKHGGICVDQAAFTVIALRSRGIPAFLFCGEGRRGGHAWVAYLKDKTHWETDIGRYRDDKYTTGLTLNPQTNRPFNDHLLPLVCEKLTPAQPKTQNADALSRLAFILHIAKLDKAARQAATLATQTDPQSRLAWEILATIADSPRELVAILEQQSQAFAKYPDLVTAFRIQQAELLRKRGHQQQADELLKNLPRNARQRDDLSTNLVQAQIDAALQQKDPQKARLILEKHLRDQKNEGAKLLDDLQAYLALTKQTSQTREALAFLTSYLKTLRRAMDKISRNDARFQNWDSQILIQAYENNGDHTKADKLRKKIKL